jgi:predicted dithiol-disulfide oxidoreductase (DUF899 family)
MSDNEKRVAQQARDRAGTREEWRAARVALLDRAPLGRNEGAPSEGSRPGRGRNPGMWFGRDDEYENGNETSGNRSE